MWLAGCALIAIEQERLDGIFVEGGQFAFTPDGCLTLALFMHVEGFVEGHPDAVVLSTDIRTRGPHSNANHARAWRGGS